MMTIRDEVIRQIKHIENKITDMQASNPYKTEESINAMYWCGRQAATTTLDFVETLRNLGSISSDEYIELVNRITDLNILLTKTRNAMLKK